MSSTSKPITIKTTTNNLITINDGTSNPMPSAIAYINPVQDLHGYDYPWLGGDGYNQWNELWELGAYNSTTGDKMPHSNAIRSVDAISIQPNTAYYFVDNENLNYRLFFYDNNGVYLNETVAYAESKAFTTPNGAYQMRFHVAYITTYSNNLAVNYPSTVTTYSPYENKCPINGFTSADLFVSPTTSEQDAIIHSVSWTSQGTVYGGYVDFVSGEMTITHVGATYDGSNDENWNWITTGSPQNYYFAITIGEYGYAVPTHIISNLYKQTTITTSTTDIGINVFNSSAYDDSRIGVRVANSGTTGLDVFRTLLSNNPLQVVYELAIPITYQLTPQEINTLLGTNYIWNNANGQTSIEYYGLKDMFTDIKSYYDNNNWDKSQVAYAVTNEWITEAQYETITGETYVAPEYTSPTLLPPVSTNEDGKIVKVITNKWNLTEEILPVETEEET